MPVYSNERAPIEANMCPTYPLTAVNALHTLITTVNALHTLIIAVNALHTDRSL